MAPPKLKGKLKDKLKMEDCIEVSKFDRCVDYEKALYYFTLLYRMLREYEDNKITRTWRAYLAVLNVMLYNGLRISEAVQASMIYYNSGETVFYMTAKKGGGERKVSIPSFIRREDLKYIEEKVLKTGTKRVRQDIDKWLLNHFNANTHSLRYAFIRYARDNEGVAEDVIAEGLGLRYKKNITRSYLRPYKTGETGGGEE